MNDVKLSTSANEAFGPANDKNFYGVFTVELDAIKKLKDRPEEIMEIVDIELKALRSAFKKEIMKYIETL